jgi:polar amino acid transport system substrate-binding protein
MKTFLLGAVLLALSVAGAPASAQAVRAVTEASQYSRLENGRVVGPANEIAEATLKRAGIADYSISLYPWARANDMALKEPNVLIYLIARTPAREAQFKWVGEFVKVEYHLYKLRDQKDVVVRKLEDARQYTIGVMRDDVRHQYLREQGFGKLVVSAQVSDNFRKLVNRQVQLMPLSETGAAQLCDEAHLDCATALEKVITLDAMTTGLYMAYSLSTPDDLVARTAASFARLKADGTVARLMNPKR